VKHWSALDRGITLSVYTAQCIATQPPELKGHCDSFTHNKATQLSVPTVIRALVNPTNEELIGTVLPYFPMAQPPPPDLLSTNWGSASIIGSGMFYAVQCVDGIVSLHGGAPLRKACEQLPIRESEELIGGGGNRCGGFGSVRCPVGSAVITGAYGDAIKKNYHFIVHTVPPLWPGVGGSKLEKESAISLLRSSFSQAFESGFSAGAEVVTAPLIGAGARKAPESIAIDCAVKGVLDAVRNRKNTTKVKRLTSTKIAAEFVLLDQRLAIVLAEAIDKEIDANIFS